MLEGVRVIEFSHAFSGPFCGKQLADLGADVIKIESTNPLTGDYIRWTGKTVRREGKEYVVSPLFDSLNRRKRSITVNLKTEEGKQIVKDLAAVSDVVLENYTPGTMERLGIGYNELINVNPKIVFCSISAFGQTGPYRQRKGYDLTLQAMSGVIIKNSPKGQMNKVGTSITDYYAALYASMGIIGALYHRERTGKGERIDISMYDSVITTLDGAIEHKSYFGEEYDRYSTVGGYGVYKCKDGFISLSVLSEKLWSDFCKLVGKEEYITDPRTRNLEARHEAGRLIDSLVAEWTTNLTVEEVCNLALNAGLPVSPVRVASENLKDPQLRSRGMFLKVRVPGLGGDAEVVASPIKTSEKGMGAEASIPILGASTKEILKLLGYADSRIDELQGKGVLK